MTWSGRVAGAGQYGDRFKFAFRCRSAGNAEGLRATALRHGFFEAEAQLLGQLFDLGCGVIFLGYRLQVFQ